MNKRIDGLKKEILDLDEKLELLITQHHDDRSMEARRAKGLYVDIAELVKRVADLEQTVKTASINKNLCR